MKKKALIFIGILFIFSSYAQIKISSSGKYFEISEKKPFFWLADTGWNLFNSLTKEEISNYLDNRKSKGFNVIQCVVVAEIENRYGELPFNDMNPSKPNEKYFQLIDWVLNEAASRGIHIALLPTWGHSVYDNPPLFDEKNAFEYGLFLGKRYKDTRNLLWVLGGDKPAYDETMDWRPVYRAMWKGIKNAGARQLVTYHPVGESSSTQFWNCEDILDFNMLQSGHRVPDLPVWEWIKRDRAYMPFKPVIDSEANYEGHPINWNPSNGYFTAYDVRKQLYRSVFSGAAGATYGHHSIWQFYYENKENISHALKFWQDAMDEPAAFQAGYLRNLIESRDNINRITKWEMVIDSPVEAAKYIAPFYEENGNYAMIYIPSAQRVEIDTKYVNGEEIRAWWFNPKNNQAQEIGKFIKKPRMTFTPPSLDKDSDWVLVIDDASKQYNAPGIIK